MKVLGIIAEYNPMHNGHIYHIQKSKELVKPDYTIVVMSGSFTEQGNIGILNKFDRAALATKYGVDLVIELPTIYAISSAKDFAYGAVKTLSNLGVITHLSFGAECNDINKLKTISEKLIQYECNINTNFKDCKNTEKKNCFASEYLEAAKDFLDEGELEILTQSNNILGIEYLNSLARLKSKIEPILIVREEVVHNSLEISLKSKYASATAIRKEILKENKNLLKNVVPEATYELLLKNKLRSNNDIFDILKYRILELKKDGLKNILDVSEGLNNRLYEKMLISTSYDEYITNVKTKRYTLGRIKRICVYILLNITKKYSNTLKQGTYARILKVNSNSRDILSKISVTSQIPVISKVSDAELQKLDNITRKNLTLDILATYISNIKSCDNISDYKNNIMT